MEGRLLPATGHFGILEVKPDVLWGRWVTQNALVRDLDYSFSLLINRLLGNIQTLEYTMYYRADRSCF